MNQSIKDGSIIIIKVDYNSKSQIDSKVIIIELWHSSILDLSAETLKMIDLINKAFGKDIDISPRYVTFSNIKELYPTAESQIHMTAKDEIQMCISGGKYCPFNPKSNSFDI